MNYDDWKTDPDYGERREREEEDPDQAMERRQERIHQEERENSNG